MASGRAFVPSAACRQSLTQCGMATNQTTPRPDGLTDAEVLAATRAELGVWHDEWTDDDLCALIRAATAAERSRPKGHTCCPRCPLCGMCIANGHDCMVNLRGLSTDAIVGTKP